MDKDMPENENYVTMPFTNARAFVDYLRPSNPEWINQGINEFIYRGAWDSSWPLLPSAWREPKPEFLENVGQYLNTFTENVKTRLERGERFENLDVAYSACHTLEILVDHALNYAAELECIWRFAALADELGFYIPERSQALSGRGFLTGVESQMTAHPRSIAAALAQHHGIPTRLLDWTSDPIKAAYFAVRPEGRPNNNENNEKQLVVWALNKNKVQCPSRSSGVRIVVYEIPRHDASFLHAQAGLFTYIENADHYFLNKQQSWPSLEKVVDPTPLNSKPYERTLVKCTLEISDINVANELRDILWQERMSTSRLMPTFDHVAQDVKTWAKAHSERPMNEKQL